MLGMAGLGYARLPQAAALLADIMPQLADQLRQFVSHAPQLSTTACISIGLLFLLQGVGILAATNRNPARMLTVICICSFLLEILIPRLIMGSIAQAESPRDLTLKARSLVRPDTRIVTFGPMQAVNWYSGRRVMVTGKLDELEFGSKQGDQSAWFPDQQALLKLWNSDNHVLVFLRKSELNDLLPGLSTAPVVQGESGRNLLISNR